MINDKDVRIGNLVSNTEGDLRTLTGKPHVITRDDFVSGFIDLYAPIPLTEDILIKAGFQHLQHMTVTNSIIKDIGRNRIISIGSVGTPNEMIWLCEIDIVNQNKITDLVCIRNYDYDGKTHVHQLQNIHYSLTGKELEVNLH